MKRQVLQDFSASGTKHQELLSIDLVKLEEDEQRPLVEFYQNNLIPLKEVPMYEIPSHIVQDMAVMLHRTFLNPDEWKELVSGMGVDDTLTISKIEASAESYKQKPLYIALHRHLSHDKSFGHIISVLLQKKRLDTLHHVKPFVENLLEQMSQKRAKKVLFESIKPTAPLDDGCCENPNALPELDCHVKSHHDLTDLSDNAFCENIQKNTSERKVQRAEKQQKAALHDEITLPSSFPAEAVPECTVVSNNLKTELHRPEIISPVLVTEPTISVFIAHTDADFDLVQRFVNILKNKQFRVITLFEMDYLLEIDPSGALNAILEEVDFIIPFISEEFLQQIQPQRNFENVEPTDAINNRSIYQSLQTEYRSNGCLNFRVRPVIMPDMDRRLLRFNALLWSSLRLWSEVPKLVKILRKTKPLIPRF